MFSILEDCKIIECVAYTGAGTTDVEGDSIDMKGFGSVCFIVSFGALTTGAITSVKVQQSDDAAGSPDGWSDLLGTSVSIADSQDDHAVAVEVIEPRKRYVRCYVDLGTANAVINRGFTILANSKVAPVTESATVAKSEQHVSPAEGTA
jgi:hypothetical protein